MIVKFNSKPKKRYIGKVLSRCTLYDAVSEKFITWYHIKPFFHREVWTVNMYDVLKVYR